jgi:hypothetical protein
MDVRRLLDQADAPNPTIRGSLKPAAKKVKPVLIALLNAQTLVVSEESIDASQLRISWTPATFMRGRTRDDG